MTSGDHSSPVKKKKKEFIHSIWGIQHIQAASFDIFVVPEQYGSSTTNQAMLPFHNVVNCDDLLTSNEYLDQFRNFSIITISRQT